MEKKKAARRSCNCARASVHRTRDANIVAHDDGFDAAVHNAGWVIGLSFGLMILVGMIGG